MIYNIIQIIITGLGLIYMRIYGSLLELYNFTLYVYFIISYIIYILYINIYIYIYIHIYN